MAKKSVASQARSGTGAGTRKTASRKAVSRDADFKGQIEAINKSQCVIEFDLDGTILSANENFLAMMGYDLDEIVGKHHRIFAEPEFANSPEYIDFWEALGRGEYQAAEFKRIAKDGREVWLQASYNPIFGDDGNPYKIVKFATDVTERKMTEAMIASQAVIEFRMDGTILSANDKFLALMGYGLDEIVGKHHSIFVGPDVKASEEYSAFWESLRRGEHQVAEFKRLRKDGHEVWLQASYTPFLDRDGKPYKVVKFATDVTQRKTAEEKIEAQHRAIMEMSTPVTAIWNDILLLPIVGFIDSQRAQDVMSAILSKIDETRARVFILDISGVAVVDTAVANHLIKITKATRLMGCECMISGLSPAIAQTIVDLGIETGGVRTTATLRDALEAAFTSIGVSVSKA
ncbi:MAG: PAS domain S-box protein [Alphaproteobacteria bacterium]|nr:PAS domain S-box protein [Alphaproteobacteria bacterium]